MDSPVLFKPHKCAAAAPDSSLAPASAPDVSLAGATSLSDIADPNTFSIGQGRQRITKADFFNTESSINSAASKGDDPFSSIDPMWSLGNK